jgi:hypothetical protein
MAQRRNKAHNNNINNNNNDEDWKAKVSSFAWLRDRTKVRMHLEWCQAEMHWIMQWIFPFKCKFSFFIVFNALKLSTTTYLWNKKQNCNRITHRAVCLFLSDDVSVLWTFIRLNAHANYTTSTHTWNGFKSAQCQWYI